LVFGQHAKKVDGVNIKRIISIIASDEYMGRETGTKGCEMAEEFFAKQYKELNLKPAGGNNSYFYNYTIPFYKVEGDPVLVVDNRTFYYGRNEDFRVANYSDGGDVTGEVVFAGYGILSKENDRNDFGNLDLKGKVVLVRHDCPNNEWDKWKLTATDSAKADYCFKNGAVAMLIFEPTQPQTTPFQTPAPVSEYQMANSLSRHNPIKGFPVFGVDERVARYILENADPNYGNISRTLDSRPISIRTGKSAKLSARVTYDRERKVRDVLAMLPGTDPRLKDEAIIVGGHMDHIGTNSNGVVNNGADDNASGPSVALGVAQAMVQNKLRPKRTIIFAAWSGEEKGLLGAEAWCNKPTWDLNKVVVYFNLDMVGLGDGKLRMPGMYYAPEVWEFIKDNSDSSYMNGVTPSRGGPGGSDHTPFLQKGVSAFAGMTSGSHPDYHQPGDDPDKISSDVLQFVGDFMYHSIEILANAQKGFIRPDRNVENKFKLAAIYDLFPVDYAGFQSSLTGKDIDISLVNLTPKPGEANFDMNFITALRLVDQALKSNATNKEYSFIQSPAEAGRLPYENKMGLVASTNLRAFNYDEVYIKALAKAGVKIGVIEKGSRFVSDSTKDNSLKNLANIGMAFVLNSLPSTELSILLKQTEKPVAVLSSGIDLLTSDLAVLMKTKGNLFIYQFSASASTDEILKNLESLKTILGKDLIALSPSDLSASSFDKMKEVFYAIDKNGSEDGFSEAVFSRNFQRFFVKATQETAQRSARVRPF
jgi:hypothetical protein